MKIGRHAIVFALFIAYGCCPIAPKKETFDIKPSDFPAEIERLKTVTLKSADKKDVAAALLKLSRLYSSHLNPNPDYKKSLSSIEAYASMNPKDGKDYEIANLISMLRILNASADDNKNLKKAIEELKKLDIMIEKRRKETR